MIKQLHLIIVLIFLLAPFFGCGSSIQKVIITEKKKSIPDRVLVVRRKNGEPSYEFIGGGFSFVVGYAARKQSGNGYEVYFLRQGHGKKYRISSNLEKSYGAVEISSKYWNGFYSKFLERGYQFTSNADDRIANAHGTYILYAKAPELKKKNPIIDDIIFSNDLTRILKIAGRPLHVKKEIVTFAGKNAGCKVLLIYPDAYYFFIAGPDFEYSKLDYAYTDNDSGGNPEYNKLFSQYRSSASGALPEWFLAEFAFAQKIPTSRNSFKKLSQYNGTSRGIPSAAVINSIR